MTGFSHSHVEVKPYEEESPTQQIYINPIVTFISNKSLLYTQNNLPSFGLSSTLTTKHQTNMLTIHPTDQIQRYETLEKNVYISR